MEETERNGRGGRKEDFGHDLVMKDQLDMNKNTRRKEMLANLFISCYTL
nr:hypothetical protein [Shuttleworthia satelles]